MDLQSNYQSTNLPTYCIINLSIYQAINLLDIEGDLLRSDVDESIYRSINLATY